MPPERVAGRASAQDESSTCSSRAATRSRSTFSPRSRAPEGDVVPNAQPGVEQIFLPHPRQTALNRLPIAGDHFSRGWRAPDRPSPAAGWFAAHAGAEQRHPLPAGDRKRQVVRQPTVADMQAQATDLDTRRRHARVSAAALRPICRELRLKAGGGGENLSLSSVIRASLRAAATPFPTAPARR